jgi:hypothetical protein
MKCQIALIHEMEQRKSRFDEMLQGRVRLSRTLKRTAIFLKNRLARRLAGNRTTPTKSSDRQEALAAGSLVRVRPRKEIRQLLDDREKYRGCLFIDEMYRHCGKTYRVLKQVDNFFDEAKQRMCRCNETYILEDVLCSGRQRLYLESCDRCCAFFWHRDWLLKLKESGKEHSLPSSVHVA